MHQQKESHSANNGINQHHGDDAGFAHPNRERSGRFSSMEWRLHELIGFRRIAQSHAAIRANLAPMQNLDESNKPLLEECIQYTTGVIEALNQYMEASKMHSGGVRESWTNLLREVEAVQKSLVRKHDLAKRLSNSSPSETSARAHPPV